MSKNYSFFSYKKGSSLLHKTPSIIKILLVPLFSILVLFLHPYFALFLVIFQFFVACLLKFSLKEQFCDLKPIIFYIFLLFIFEFLSVTFEFFLSPSSLNENSSLNSFLTLIKAKFNWQNQKESVFFLLKLFSIMQTSSLVFKTSTSLEMRLGIAKIFGQKSAITNALSMFMNFLPMIAKIWEESKRAWFARGGKKGVKMYKTLLPVLFSVGLKKAWNVSRALYIRM